MIAVIPAAGQGTRMAEITGGAPKELLEVAGKPVLAHVLDEAFLAGCNEAVVVSSPAKPEIDRFVESLGDRRIRVAHQDRPLGFAHAIHSANIGPKPSVILVADTVYYPCSPTQRLVQNKINAGLAVQTVSQERMSRYGIVETDAQRLVTRILEKPEPEETLSRLAVSARWKFPAGAWAILEEMFAGEPTPEWTGWGTTEVLQALLATGEPIVALELTPSEVRHDCGNPEGYRNALTQIT